MYPSKYSIYQNRAALLAITIVLSACGENKTMDITKDPTNGATIFDWPYILFPIGILIIVASIAWEKIKNLFK